MFANRYEVLHSPQGLNRGYEGIYVEWADRLMARAGKSTSEQNDGVVFTWRGRNEASAKTRVEPSALARGACAALLSFREVWKCF